MTVANESIPSAAWNLRAQNHIAMEMLLTGRRLDVEEAHCLGLVNAVVPGRELMDKAREIAQGIAAGPPLVHAAIKYIVRATAAMTIPECYAWTKSGACETYTALMRSHDVREGPRAFAEGREPVWTGR